MAALDVDALAVQWLARQQGKALSDVGKWVRIRVGAVVEKLREVLRELVNESRELGVELAQQQLGPAYERAVEVQLPPRLDEIVDQVITGRVEALAGELTRPTDKPDVDELAARLAELITAPAWAERVALTESAEAMSAASQATYRANDIRRNRWEPAPDERVCLKCQANADDGPIPVGDAFSSGAAHPPQHPHCRCCLMPVIERREA
jgi:SPP1 gp7 family putative phage head morphogenesis protein